jgi:alpha-tubulin suppressor-like RCC1 family protein
VVAGGAHACVLRDDGSVACWGFNQNGQLGDATNVTRNVARGVDLQGLKPGVKALALAAGDSHTCVVLDAQVASSGGMPPPTGNVACWGGNSQGQLGNGTMFNQAESPSVVATSNAIAIAAGDQHTCMLNSDHTVSCWGSSAFGQLGAGDMGGMAVPLPQKIAGLASVDQLAASGNTTCAHLSTDNSVMCWGRNDDGQVGNGETVNKATPQKVSALTASKIAVGGHHACAIKLDGGLVCWGAGYVGQIGDGGYAGHFTPAQVPSLSTVRELSAGAQHTCAVLSDTSVTCWGDDRSGELGDGLVADRAPVAPLLACPQ